MRRALLLGIGAIGLVAIPCYIAWKSYTPHNHKGQDFFHEVSLRSFSVEVSALGELEAATSQMISSRLKGDQAKVIHLVADGTTVKTGDVLVRIDPAPFESRVAELKGKIYEQSAYLQILQQTIEWETHQAHGENQSADYELACALLEQEKVKNGDGPLEVLRVEAALQKARVSLDELQGFTDDLSLLDQEGFLNEAEKKMAFKKLAEAQEAYDGALAQRNSYVEHVYPMLLKKGEASVKRAAIKKDETLKNGEFRIGKAVATFQQAQTVLKELQNQLKDAETELALTEIKAPGAGMVVLREDYRNGQKRKCRVGDILVRNQPVIDLPDLKQMIVRTKVREIDLHKIALEKWALIEVDAYPQLALIGKVASIGVLALSDPGKAGDEKYFEVKVAINGYNAHLRPGMSAKVFIQGGKVKQKPAIPLHAVYLEEKKAHAYVWNRSKIEKRPIEIGLCNHEWAEVLCGLRPKDQVLLSITPEEEAYVAAAAAD